MRVATMLRRADPVRAQALLQDMDGEADLATLVGEQPVERQRSRPSRAPLVRGALVLGVVLAIVGCGSAVVLTSAHSGATGIAHPTPVTGEPSSPPTIDGCDPVAVQPFLCGTYRSVFGVPAVSGAHGGPAKDPVSISFSAKHGALVVHALGSHCFSATVEVQAVRVGNSGDIYELRRKGPVDFGGKGCSGGSDTASWAASWLSAPHEVATDGGLTFDPGHALVTFDYEGTAPLGAPQAPRYEPVCVPADTAPFGCGTYRSLSGTGSLAYLATDRYRLSFVHINGGLEALFDGGCNGAAAFVEVAGSTVVGFPGPTTLVGCAAKTEAEDRALGTFMTGVLHVRVSGGRIVFTRGADSAVFKLR